MIRFDEIRRGRRALHGLSVGALAVTAALTTMPAAAQADRGAGDAGEPGRGGYPSSREGGDGSGRSAGQMIDDATISTRIKASFIGSKEVKARDIQVETREGVVQLSGFADSREEVEKAAEIAKGTPGVRSVTNSIQMRPAPKR